jgi:predicted RND superfamily exporter protein
MKGEFLINFSIDRPKTVTAVLVVCTMLLASLMVNVRVDTDPENMLSEHEEVRVFHDQMKQEFNLNDYVVLGVVNKENPAGIFNIETLTRVHDLTEFVRNMHDPDEPEKRVVSANLIAPGSVDAIEQAGLGQVSFDWLMKDPPANSDDVERIRNLAMNNPLLRGTLVSEDMQAMGIYIPVSQKDFASQVRKRLLKKIDEYDSANGDQFYITGLPVAEDTFGEEMFVQMAVSAPLAMLAIFLLMLAFFRQVKMIISPMIVAIMSVFCTMGLLIGTGNTLHIMSSMIPIFLMPIAVVDSIHILSEFFDSYQKIGDRRKTIVHVMGRLFMPMLYTSLTSAAGFASLALTPIPPVQAFGVFVAVGIILAWLFTIIFVPAYIMMLNEESLAGFGAGGGESGGVLSVILKKAGRMTYDRAKVILVLTLAAIIAAGSGISLIKVNDNPVKWFSKKHPIRVADRVLNEHFGGTYESYLVLESAVDELDAAGTGDWLHNELDALEVDETGLPVIARAHVLLDKESARIGSVAGEDLLAEVLPVWEQEMDDSADEHYDTWADVVDLAEKFRNRTQVFKEPEVLEYIASLQKFLAGSVIGKSNSLADVVQKVHQELFEGREDHYSIPASTGGVAECLISFQNSHKPDDLWHFVTPDYRKANIWMQLRNGDNQDMQAVIDAVDGYFNTHQPPASISYKWAGLTYLNVVWQDKMVFGMRDAFLSSFLVVFVMMVVLFRSVLWGALAMVPLSVTIAFIYGLIGFIGKEYDMPVAVLSSLTLGLAVDFAIHFLERSRVTYKKTGSWKTAVGEMFEDPARAISRNVIVIAIGFTPLLAAPLVPYKTVGVFLASIMAISGISTMFILPSVLTVLERRFFKKI